MNIIRQQQYVEVIHSHALRLFADYQQRLIAAEDVAWLPDHEHTVSTPAAGSLANRICRSSSATASWSL
jgi:hypothetical protein